MSRNSAIAVVLLALATTSVLTAGEFFSGTAPRTSILAQDSRTDFERLEDRVDELSFFLAEAEYAIAAQRQQIEALQEVQSQNQSYFNDLASHIIVDPSGLTISAPEITLDSDYVHIDAPLARVDGTIESEIVKTDAVISKTYTPGAGNLW